ncbi:MAG: dihydrolipoyl dehydrogenase [Planctomycetes bacterium]|nr:dihydrolipoyl dehydrogenase [Planctomycetota bacterium]
MKTDIAVLGGGPGGYSAAFRAADLGAEVVIVEQRGRLGGLCLHEGCIPSKALLHVGRGIARADELAEWGVRYDRPPAIDVDALRDRKNRCIGALAGGLDNLARQRKVRVIRARAALEGSGTLRLDGEGLDDDRLESDAIILATGSLPLVPPPLRIDSERLMTSREALALPEIPQTLLVIGGAYVGLEMATTYARLGSRVTVVEMLDRLMSGADADLVKPLRQAIEPLMEQILLGTKVESVREQNGRLEVTMTREGRRQTGTYDRVLVAVGHRPCLDGIALESTGVEIGPDGFVKVDGQQRTTDGRIFAVGDIAGAPLLAHKAFKQGLVAAEVIVTGRGAFDARAIPQVVFTDPEVAWVGVTESQVRDEGLAVDVARYPWAASGRAQTLGRTEGLTKLLFQRDTGRLVGAGIVGADCGDLIAECALAIEGGLRARDLADTVHQHPTLSETVADAAAAWLGEATEIAPRHRAAAKEGKP